MKYQESKLTGLRWYVGILGIGCMVWVWAISWVIVMMSLKNITWVVEWLTYIVVGCSIIVILLPSENKNETKKERSKSEKVGDG